MSVFPVALSDDNLFMITTDGNIVIGDRHDKDDGLWQWQANANVTSVRVVGDTVLVLDDNGQLTWLSVETGSPQHVWDTHLPLRGLVCSGEKWAAVDRKGVYLGDRNGVKRHFELSSATCCEFSHSGAYLAAGTDDGVMIRIDLQSEERLEITLPHTIDCIASFPNSYWFASGDGLHVIKEDLSGFELWPGMGKELTGVASSREGRFFAARFKDNIVVAVDLAGSKTVWHTLQFPEHSPGQLQFSKDDWLGIAIGHGDGNKWRINKDEVHRNDPPPGRPRNHWFVIPGKIQVTSGDNGTESGSGLKYPGCVALLFTTILLLACGCVGAALYYLFGLFA